MGSIHTNNKWADQVSFVARESCEKELLGKWTAGSQVQDGQRVWIGVCDSIPENVTFTVSWQAFGWNSSEVWSNNRFSAFLNLVHYDTQELVLGNSLDRERLLNILL